MKTETRWGIRDGAFYKCTEGGGWTVFRDNAERFTHPTAETLMLAMIQAGTVGDKCRVIDLDSEEWS